MKTNYHTHTTRCMHATGDDEDYVLSAIKGGYRILGFSDHTPWKYRTDYVADMRMLPEELPGYVERVVRRFADDHEGGETFSAWAKRSDEEALR